MWQKGRVGGGSNGRSVTTPRGSKEFSVRRVGPPLESFEVLVEDVLTSGVDDGGEFGPSWLRSGTTTYTPGTGRRTVVGLRVYGVPKSHTVLRGSGTDTIKDVETSELEETDLEEKGRDRVRLGKRYQPRLGV